MSDLAAFLAARLDEDERLARQALEETGTVRETRYPYPDRLATCMHDGRHSPARVLREVGAKCAILAEHEPQPWGEPQPQLSRCPAHGDETTGWWTQWPCVEVRALAAVWSDHPDYDEAWRP